MKTQIVYKKLVTKLTKIIHFLCERLKSLSFACFSTSQIVASMSLSFVEADICVASRITVIRRVDRNGFFSFLPSIEKRQATSGVSNRFKIRRTVSDGLNPPTKANCFTWNAKLKVALK